MIARSDQHVTSPYTMNTLSSRHFQMMNQTNLSAKECYLDIPQIRLTNVQGYEKRLERRINNKIMRVKRLVA